MITREELLELNAELLKEIHELKSELKTAEMQQKFWYKEYLKGKEVVKNG